MWWTCDVRGSWRILLTDVLAVNTHDKRLLPMAARLGFGLEVVEYMQPLAENEILEKQAAVSRLMDGFSRFTFHGAVIDYDDIGKQSEEGLLSWGQRDACTGFP